MDEWNRDGSTFTATLAGQQIGDLASGQSPGTGLTPDTFAEVRERALRTWAIEQAVQACRLFAADGVTLSLDPLAVADRLLAYVSQPVVAASSKLIDAARAYDGTQNAAALIGALADALESREVR